MKSLTKNQWKVLKYFIDKESEVIERRQKKDKGIIDRSLNSSNFNHFFAYPAKISRELNEIPTKPAITDIATKFYNEEIFGIEEERFKPPRKGETTKHYFINSDLNAFRKVVRYSLDYSNKYLTSLERIDLFNQTYFQFNINEKLIKAQLAEKKVEIHRYLDLLDWDEKEARILFDFNEKYLFSWDEIPGKDTWRLIEFLKQDFGLDLGITLNHGIHLSENESSEADEKTKEFLIKKFAVEWVRTAKIEKIDDGKAMKYFTEKNFLELRNNDMKTSIIVKIDDGRTYEILPQIISEIDERFLFIEKSSDGRSIKIYNEEKRIISLICDIKNKILLEIDDGRTCDLISYRKNNKLDIFKKNPNEDITFEQYIQKNIREYENQKTYFDPIESKDWLFIPLIPFRFPIFPYSKSEDERIRIIEQYNEEMFRKFPIFRKIRSGFLNHEKKNQYENLILPILSLITASTAALDEFLNGNWEPFVLKWKYSVFKLHENRMHCNFILKLLFITINDIAMTLDIPRGGIVQDVCIRSSPIMGSIKQKDSLMEISLKNYMNLYFDAWFNTVKEKSTSVQLETKKNDETQYWVKTWIKPQKTGFSDFIASKFIKNPKGLVIKLQERTPISKHLRDLMSNRMKIILSVYDISHAPSNQFLTMLYNEINILLRREDFYKEEVFKYSPITDNTLNLIKYNREQKKDLLKNDNKEETILFWIIRANRSLLEEVFPDEIIKLKDYKFSTKELMSPEE
jgi:hypothetical protein